MHPHRRLTEAPPSLGVPVQLPPGGTGAVVLPGLTINDHNVTGTRSNEDLNITASGSGVVLLGPITVNGSGI